MATGTCGIAGLHKYREKCVNRRISLGPLHDVKGLFTMVPSKGAHTTNLPLGNFLSCEECLHILRKKPSLSKAVNASPVQHKKLKSRLRENPLAFEKT